MYIHMLRTYITQRAEWCVHVGLQDLGGFGVWGVLKGGGRIILTEILGGPVRDMYARTYVHTYNRLQGIKLIFLEYKKQPRPIAVAHACTCTYTVHHTAEKYIYVHHSNVHIQHVHVRICTYVHCNHALQSCTDMYMYVKLIQKNYSHFHD